MGVGRTRAVNEDRDRRGDDDDDRDGQGDSGDNYDDRAVNEDRHWHGDRGVCVAICLLSSCDQVLVQLDMLLLNHPTINNNDTISNCAKIIRMLTNDVHGKLSFLFSKFQDTRFKSQRIYQSMVDVHQHYPHPL